MPESGEGRRQHIEERLKSLNPSDWRLPAWLLGMGIVFLTAGGFFWLGPAGAIAVPASAMVSLVFSAPVTLFVLSVVKADLGTWGRSVFRVIAIELFIRGVAALLLGLTLRPGAAHPLMLVVCGLVMLSVYCVLLRKLFGLDNVFQIIGLACLSASLQAALVAIAHVMGAVRASWPG